MLFSQNANDIEQYTFVLLFVGKFDPPLSYVLLKGAPKKTGHVYNFSGNMTNVGMKSSAFVRSSFFIHTGVGQCLVRHIIMSDLSIDKLPVTCYRQVVGLNNARERSTYGRTY